MTQNASIDNKTVTDNSEEPQGDIEMKDEDHSPGAAGAAASGGGGSVAAGLALPASNLMRW